MKSELRKKQKALRNSLDMENLSEVIVNNFFELDCFKNSKNIFSYISFSSELKTDKILELSDKNIFVPKVLDDEMIMTRYDKCLLIKNQYGILETVSSEAFAPKKNDVVVVPALAVDKNFNRLGYGGGFYDKFFKKNSCVKVVLIPEKLFVDVVPVENFDEKVDIIVTEKTVYIR